MVFQFYALYPALTVRANIMFPLHVEGLDVQTSAERVARVARMLQLEAVLDRLPNHISEGEKQRVAVARAVVRDPNCFLFDEPLSRLDVELRQTMRGQIKSVLTGLSKATVIVTHDQLEALAVKKLAKGQVTIGIRPARSFRTARAAPTRSPGARN
jgi:multiple sugar transport system ATP-binding protein